MISRLDDWIKELQKLRHEIMMRKRWKDLLKKEIT